MSMTGLEGLDELAPEDLQDEVAARLRLYFRSHDYYAVIPYVEHIKAEGHPDRFWAVLEKVMDDLDRGYSDTLEEFAEWKRDMEEARRQRERHLVALWDAADLWADHRAKQLESGVRTGERLRIEREQERLVPALEWAVGELQAGKVEFSEGR